MIERGHPVTNFDSAMRIAYQEVGRRCRRYSSYYDDMFSDAQIGVIRALRDWDPSANYSFEAAATMRIRSAIINGLVKRCGTRGQKITDSLPEYTEFDERLAVHENGYRRIEDEMTVKTIVRSARLTDRERHVVERFFFAEEDAFFISRGMGRSVNAVDVARRSAVAKLTKVA